MKNVTIYTDGACSGNPGPGGWGSILVYNERDKEISGHVHHTTNNRMELLAVIQGLNALKEPCEVQVHSDSAYVVSAVENQWLLNWSNNGWRTSKKKTVENQDLWMMLLPLLAMHRVTFVKVLGHSGVELNERCDVLAKNAVKGLPIAV